MEETGSILHTRLPACNRNCSKNPYGLELNACAHEPALLHRGRFSLRMTAQDLARKRDPLRLK